jgi:hypothetical protein
VAEVQPRAVGDGLELDRDERLAGGERLAAGVAIGEDDTRGRRDLNDGAKI